MESTLDPAVVFYATMQALRSQEITADEARARNRALKDRIGAAAFDVAKTRAVVADARNGCG